MTDRPSRSAPEGEDPTARMQAEIADLRRALQTQPAIDQAKGMLMLRYGVDDVAAFALLERVSQHHNVKIRDIAQAMTVLVPQGDAGAPDSTAATLARQLLDGGSAA